MSTDRFKIGAGLRSIRRRRMLLWGVIISYPPMIWITQTLTRSDMATMVVFGIWVVFLWNSVMLVAFVRCPRCGAYYHIKFLFPQYLRSCRHCGLPLNADKKGDSVTPG